MTDSERTDGVADDVDAPWRPGYSGPEPRPPERPRAPAESVSSQPAWEPPAPVDPWSRTAKEHAELDVPEGLGPVPADRVLSGPGEVDPQVVEAVGPSSSTLGVVLTGALVAVVVFVAAAIAVSWSGDGDTGDAPAIPRSAEPLWSVEVDGRARAVVDDDTVYVVSATGIDAFDARTGEERWSYSDSALRLGPTVEIVGDTVVLFDVATAGSQVNGLDIETGTLRWNRRMASEHSPFVVADRLFELDFQRAEPSVTPLDSATGLPASEPLEVRSVLASEPHAPVVDDGRIGLLDVIAGESVGPSVELSGLTALALAGDSLVGVIDRIELVTYDDAGEIADRLDVAGMFDLTAVWSVPDADRLLVAATTNCLSVGVVDGRVEVDWSIAGRLAAAGPTDRGSVVVLAPVGAGRMTRVADAASGEVLFEFASEPRNFSGFADYVLGRDGVVHRRSDDVVAFDLDGRELWSIDERFDEVAVGGGVVALAGVGVVSVFG